MTAIRIIAYAPNGESLGPIPTPQEVQASYPLNDVGALTMAYPPQAPRASLLGQPLELVTEVSHDAGDTWLEPDAGRFLYMRDGRDPVRTADAYAVEAVAYIHRLKKALVGFRSLNSEGARVFTEATPGAILRTLILEAQQRGALQGLTLDWTNERDSTGALWPEVIPALSLDPGKDLLSVLQDLQAMGHVDFTTRGRGVRLYVADHPAGMGADRTVGQHPVTLRFGRDLTEAPFRRTWEGLADTAMVMGDNGVSVTRTNVEALRPWGRQETYATASGVSDQGTLYAVSDAILAQSERERLEHTLGLNFRGTPHLPFRDYAPGEWVTMATPTGAERVRVMQVTLTRGSDGVAAGNVVLNDRFVNSDVQQARRLERILQGATPAGTGAPPASTPGGNDILAPAAPVGFAASSAAYVNDNGITRAQITLQWEDVTTNADGTIASDVDHYEVWRRQSGVSDWVMVGTTTASAWYSSDYQPGTLWDFRVRAVDRVWNRSAYSRFVTVTAASDTTPPSRPSEPSVTTRLGVARIAWDGATLNGSPQPADFSRVEYHCSPINNTAQDPAVTRVGTSPGAGMAVAGPLNYGQPYFAWVVAVDTSGNRSQASPVASFTVASLVDVSNFPDDAMQELFARTAHFIEVTADMLAANSVKTMHLDSGAVTAEKMSIYSRRPTVLPNSWMEGVHATIARPSHWGIWFVGGTTSTMSFSPTPISGERSLRVTSGATSTWTIGSDVGNWVPVQPGQAWTVRALFRPAVAVPAGKRFWLRFYTAAPGVNPIGFTGDRTQQNVVLTGPMAAGTTYTMEGTFAVPAGHTQAGLAIVQEAMGVDMVTDWDGIELAPGVTSADVTEISPGKIGTGTLQAHVRVIAGNEAGARTEMAGTGWAAYAPDGVTKTFEVRASDGAVYTAGTFTTRSAGFGRVEISALSNPYQSNQQWNTLQFYSDNPSWSPGMIWAAYSPDGWGTLELVGPRLGSRPPARITMKSVGPTENVELVFHANGIRAWADVYTWGDPKGIVTFRLAYSANSQRLSFQSSGFKRIEFRYDVFGVNQIVSQDESAAWNTLVLAASGLRIEPQSASGNLDVGGSAGQNNRVAIRTLQTGYSGVSLVFGVEDLFVKTWNGSNFLPIHASAFTVNSDLRTKSDLSPVSGALAGVRSVQAYDYLTLNGNGHHGTEDGYRRRGLVAQEVATQWPEAVAEVGENPGDDLSVDLYHLVGTLWAAVGELAESVDTLKRDTDTPREE